MKSNTLPIVVRPAGGIPLRKRQFLVKGTGRKLALTAIIDKNPANSMQRATPMALRDRLVLNHLPLVSAIAVRLHQSLPAHVALEDMIQAGNLGLLRAAGKYDSKKKVVFSAYAKHRIRGAILDSLRELDWKASRTLRSTLGEAVKKLPERYQKVVLLYHYNEMTMKEIAWPTPQEK